MPKGVTNNPNGRPKGSKNKASVKLKNFIADFFEDNLDRIQDDFDSLEPKERLTFLVKLMSYVIPRIAPETPEVEKGTKHIPIVPANGVDLSLLSSLGLVPPEQEEETEDID